MTVITTHPHYPAWELPPNAGWSSSEVLDGVAVRRVLHYVPSRPVGVRRALAEASFGARAVATRWGKPDVIICPSPALISTAFAVTRAQTGGRRAAVGVVVQDLYSLGIVEAVDHAGPAVALLSGLEGWVLRRADGVVAIHDRFRARMVSSLGVASDRVDVIRNWTHVQAAPAFDHGAFRAAMGWRPDEVVVLHAGAMGEKQALANVVEAARLAEANGQPVRFVLLGSGGQRPILEEMGRRLRQLDFMDPLPGDAYAKALAAADVLLVNEKPGVLEMAVPSKLTSYFTAGRPVLAATDPRSITASEVDAAGAGVVVPPGDPAALMSAALTLGEDRLKAAEYGARGRLYCQTHLSEEAALDAYDRWVRELHARRQSRVGAR